MFDQLSQQNVHYVFSLAGVLLGGLTIPSSSQGEPLLSFLFFLSGGFVFTFLCLWPIIFWEEDHDRQAYNQKDWVFQQQIHDQKDPQFYQQIQVEADLEFPPQIQGLKDQEFRQTQGQIWSDIYLILHYPRGDLGYL